MYTENNGNPVTRVVRTAEDADIEERANQVLGSVRKLQSSLKTGQNVRDMAVTANQQMKRLQEKIGEIVKNS